MSAKPGRTSHIPGMYVLDEMAARGWTVERLAQKMGLPKTRATYVKRIICGELITPEIAEQLGRAFGTSYKLWLNLEKAYRASLEATRG
jgi:plasmid maintenance system antidote protein VapI